MNEILRRRVLATVAAAGLMAIPALGDGPVDVLVDLGVDEGRAEQLLERWQDHHETSEDELVDILATAIENQAPPGLLIDKAAEGLAKSIPSSRLLPALRTWGEQIAVAAKLAEELEGEFDTEGMPMRSVVLRLHLLRRSRVDDAPGSSSPSRHRTRR
jgi:hypothetical protein